MLKTSCCALQGQRRLCVNIIHLAHAALIATTQQPMWMDALKCTHLHVSAALGAMHVCDAAKFQFPGRAWQENALHSGIRMVGSSADAMDDETVLCLLCFP